MNHIPGFTSLTWPVVIWLFGTVPWLMYRIFFHKKGHLHLKGKVVLITGASSGLGEALAHVFYRIGCKVILASRTIEQLERVKADLLAAHTIEETYAPEILQLDLSDLQNLPNCVKSALEFHGRIDILINNGGISYRGNVLNTSIETDLKIMMVNYFGQICLTKAVLPSMVKNREGHIVAISSVQGRIAIPYRSAYTASKHALQAFCDSLRAEMTRHNVNVTVISPGYVNTNLSLNALTGSGDIYGVLDETTATGYTPEYVAREVLSAVSEKKKEVTISTPTHKIAILLRVLCPSLFFYIMEKRALKLKS